MIEPFGINLDETTRIYNTLVEAGCEIVKGDWTPEKYELRMKQGRKSPTQAVGLFY